MNLLTCVCWVVGVRLWRSQPVDWGPEQGRHRMPG